MDCADSFLTINAAAQVAMPGDVVVIRPGIYRERISPPRGGDTDRPIRYVAPEGGVSVRGSIVFTPHWERNDRGLWRAEVDADLFPGKHLLRTPLLRMPGLTCGQLFVHGQPMTELIDEAAAVHTPGTFAVTDNGNRVALHLPRGIDHPDEASIELTVLDRLFAPVVRGLGHIDLDGITFEHCGNQFPSGFWKGPGEGGHPQAGAVGCRGGHHWRIERCTIRHAKTIGLDCGDEGGWDVETGESIVHDPTNKGIGGHQILHNDISDNGACGIAAATGFNTHIVGNRVERNNALGCRAPETAGIKVHFFTNGLIADNLIRDNDASGIWLDNQWYGTTVTRNVCVNNYSRAIFVEMGEGPCEVSNNICALTRCGDGLYAHDASGVTFRHNLTYGNAHFGLYARYVTDRELTDAHGQRKVSACRNLTIQHNVFVDNYRGAVCLPPEDGDRVSALACDENLFFGGTQWQWQGLPPHIFCSALDDDQVARVADDDTDKSARVAYLTPDAWRARGYDLGSHLVKIGTGGLEDGAVAKGWSEMSSRSLTLWLADAGPLLRTSADGEHPWGPFAREQLAGGEAGCLLPLWHADASR